MLYAIIAAVIVTALTGVGSWFAGAKDGRYVRDLECKAEISLIRDELAETTRQAHALREKSRIVADNLARQLADARDGIARVQTKLDRAIAARASATRRSLDGDIVRMLNEQSTITERVEPIGATRAAAPGTAAPPAAPAADRDRPAGGASERAVATALSQARAGYEACRAQLHRLIDWAESVTSK